MKSKLIIHLSFPTGRVLSDKTGTFKAKRLDTADPWPLPGSAGHRGPEIPSV